MNNQLPTVYQQCIHKSRYSRWIDDEERRENWDETVSRYISFMGNYVRDKHNYILPDSLKAELEDAILGLSVMPSMRAMMTSGPALARDHNAGSFGLLAATILASFCV